jgi:hypothetical protein
LEVAPVSVTKFLERPSALPVACAPAHADGVGYLTVLPVSPQGWRRTSERLLAAIQQFQQEESVQLQVSRVRIDGTNGLTAKATGMAKTSAKGVDASGVPPRGKPV